MPSYLFFFESELFPVSQNLDEFWFNSIQKDSIVANKINCSFLKNEKNELYQDIQKLLATQIPNCEVIEYGKMTLLVEHDYTVSFIIFISKEPIIEKVNGNGYLSPKFEELKKIAIKVRNFLSESKNILIVKRLVSNIFLPDRLKEEFDRTIKRDIEKEKSNIDGSLKTYYQNNVNYPFLIEFQTNFSLNHEERFNEMINDYYLKFFPFIKETGI